MSVASSTNTAWSHDADDVFGTHSVLDAVNHGGTYTWPINGATFPRIQVITIRELLEGKRPGLPTLMLPYIQAAKAPAAIAQGAFEDIVSDAV